MNVSHDLKNVHCSEQNPGYIYIGSIQPGSRLSKVMGGGGGGGRESLDMCLNIIQLLCLLFKKYMHI